MKVTIARSTVILPDSVVGILLIDNVPKFVTLENRYKMIRPGTFTAKRDTHWGNPGSTDNYIVWELQDVPNRDQIQIHIGNMWSDSKGCILIGESFNRYTTLPYLLNSTRAHNEFMNLTSNMDTITVEVI